MWYSNGSRGIVGFVAIGGVTSVCSLEGGLVVISIRSNEGSDRCCVGDWA